MVLPIQGPTYRVRHSPGIIYRSAQVWSQAKPYNLPLQYALYQGYVESVSGSGMSPYEQDALDNESLLLQHNELVTVRNRAYERLRAEVGDSASLGAALAEFEQSADMIAKRSIQLARIFKAVRKMHLTGGDDSLSSLLGLTKSQARRAEKHVRKRDASGLLLEVNYGWIPLADDIKTSLEVLVSAEPRTKVRGKATIQTQYDFTDRTTSPTFVSDTSINMSGTLSCLQQCMVKVDNPNLWLANQLGLINPISIVWETTYMSHVADWFLGVGAVINSITDWVGLSVTDGFHTSYHKYRMQRQSYLWVNGETIRDGRLVTGGVTMNRSLGIANPVINPQWGIKSWKRAANAWAQLIQQLPR